MCSPELLRSLLTHLVSYGSSAQVKTSEEENNIFSIHFIVIGHSYRIDLHPMEKGGLRLSELLVD